MRKGWTYEKDAKNSERSFLALLLTVAWGGQAKLKADSGGYFACYGYCTILWDCAGSVDGEYIYMDDGGACIRLIGCVPSEVTISLDDPWDARQGDYELSPHQYVEFQLFDQTIYPSGYSCQFSPLPW
jgi:hypothetical protein